MQYDTIYHEHFSYFLLGAAAEIFGSHGLEVYDVAQLPTHGGSLRLHAQPLGGPMPSRRPFRRSPPWRKPRVCEARSATPVSRRTSRSPRGRFSTCSSLRRDGKQVVGYGAPGKGNTLLNYCGIRTDLLDYKVDRNPERCGDWAETQIGLDEALGALE